MGKTKVKICGLTDMKTAIAAVEAGADLLGLVFAQSRRQITPEKAVPIIDAIHTLRTRSCVVGIFVNTAVTEINHVAEYCNLDIIQLSGNEDPEQLREIFKPVIKVVHVDPSKTAKDIVLKIENFKRRAGSHLTFMLDTQVEGQYGGSGKTFRVNIARNVAARFPIFVAGGLTPENVGDLVKTVRPLGVDVSGGVETDGSKDISKIRKFIKMVKHADEEH